MPEEEDQIRPINAAGDYIDGRVGIEDAHRRAVMHKEAGSRSDVLVCLRAFLEKWYKFRDTLLGIWAGRCD